MRFISAAIGVWLWASQAVVATADREPLLDRQGRALFEGRRIILDSDSYPREPGKIVSGPTLSPGADRFQIRFEIDKPDDVLLRIVDRQGTVLRTLGCGLLGPNAPEPFASNTLRQTVAWDGTDRAGRPVPAGCHVQLAVGLKPRFVRFVGYDPAQLLGRVIWLEVDPQGRLYVQLGTGRKIDPVILRFSREGRYLDMVYPSSPQALAASGKQIEDVWPFVARYQGESIPHRPRSWPTFVPYRADPSIPFPMRIAADGTVYFAEATTGYPRWASRGELLRLFTTHVDHFWFLQMMPLMYSIGPFAIDGQGCAYIVTSTAEKCTGTYPPTLKALSDPRAPGTIRKVNLKTGQLQADFEYNGTQRQENPSAYLGLTQTVAAAQKSDRDRPDPACDGPQRFVDMVDLTVDPAGRILVADGWPRRVKIYAANGRFLGELSALDVQGQQRAFQDLRGIAWAEDGFYLLGTFRGQADKTFLARCDGDPLRPRVAWLVPLDGQARHLAVDRAAQPRLLWVGCGHGPATLSRVEDLRDRAGEIRRVGGTPPRQFVYPWGIAADEGGRLFVHDRDRESLIRTTDTLADWQEVPLRGAPLSVLVDRSKRRLLLTYSLGENGSYSKERLEESGLVCLDLETLQRQPFRLQPVYTPQELAQRDKLFATRPDAYYPWAKTYGGLLAGKDAGGNLYVRDADRGQKWHKATPTDKVPCAGVIRKYAADGTIADEAYCRLHNTGGGVAMDSRGFFYAVELPRTNWNDVVHNFTAAIGQQSFGAVPSRGDVPIRTQSGFTHVVKMDARGGARDTDAELWAHRGVSCTNGGGCYCDWPDVHLAVDGADRVCVADVDLHMIKILDTAGNMLARVGRWGNAETVPGPDGNPLELGFRMIYCLAAAGDKLYVSDKDLRRIALVQMEYRHLRQTPATASE